jgi:hypothetical protein
MDPFRKDLIKPAILGALAAICVVLEVSIHLMLGTAIGYTHFFYLLLVLAAIWYNRKAVIIAVALAIATIAVSYYVHDMNMATFVRAGMFIIVTVIVGEVSRSRDIYHSGVIEAKGKLQAQHEALIAYVSEIAMRIRNPINHIRESISLAEKSLDEEPPDLISARMILAVQVSNADQIIENTRQLNEALIKENKDIPEAYAAYLNQ